MDDTDTTREPVRWPWALRALYIVSLLAFLLPFTTVKSCSTKEVKEYTGTELLAEGDGVMLFILVLSLVLLGLSFVQRRSRPAQDGLLHAGRSFWAVLAVLAATVGVSLQHLFDGVSALIGQWLCAGSWTVVLLLSLALAWLANARMLRAQPSLRGAARTTALWFGLLLVAAVLVAFFGTTHEDVGERQGSALLTLILGIPLAAVLYFGVMLTKARAHAEQDGRVDSSRVSKT